MFLWAAVLVIIPLIYVVVLSFATRGPAGNVIFKFTLANYARLMDKVYLSIFRDSLKIAFMTTLLTFLAGYPFGYFVARARKRNRVYLLLLVMVPFWTNSLLRVNGWIMILRPDGIINTVLMSLRIVSEPVMTGNRYWAVLMTTVYMLLPFMVLPIYNAVEKLDKSLIEASQDLGAGSVKTFFRITLPLTFSGAAAGAALVFIPAVGLYFISQLVGDGKSMLIGNLIHNLFTSSRNWPFGSALAVMMIAGTLVFVLIAKKLSKDGEGGFFP